MTEIILSKFLGFSNKFSKKETGQIFEDIDIQYITKKYFEQIIQISSVGIDIIEFQQITLCFNL